MQLCPRNPEIPAVTAHGGAGLGGGMLLLGPHAAPSSQPGGDEVGGSRRGSVPPTGVPACRHQLVRVPQSW